MADRAKYIQLGVQNGVTSLSDIIDTYNSYAKGGRVNTRAGEQTIGSYIKLKSEPFFRRVNSDGTLTKAKDDIMLYSNEERQWYKGNGEVVSSRDWLPNNSGGYTQYDFDGKSRSISEEQYNKWNKAQNIRLRADSLAQDFDRKREQSLAIARIPKIPEQRIVLTQNIPGGLNYDNGTVVYKNQLDTIAKYGKLAGIPLVDALGIPARETAFTGGYATSSDIDYIRPADMVSNWNYTSFENPYSNFLRVTQDPDFWKGRRAMWTLEGEKMYDVYINPDREDVINRTIESWPYTKKTGKKVNPSVHPLLHSFTDFRRRNPNPKNKEYKKQVRKRGEELLQSPEIQDWMNTSPYIY